jgi:glutathione S-transferase
MTPGTGTLILYTGEKNVSSWSMRGFLAVLHKNVPFQEQEISLPGDKSRARRREVSPTGKVPVLHHVRPDGRLVIPDSLAIMEYLEEAFPPPAHPAIWPAEPTVRARARWLAAAMHSGFGALRESMSFNLCFHPQPPQATPAALADAAEILQLWESSLQNGGPFLCGDYGGADIMFAPVVWRLTAFRVPAGSTPRAAAYMERMLEHPHVRRWMDPAKALPPVASY